MGGVYVANSDKSFNITVKYPFNYNNRTVVFTDEDAPLDNFNFDPAIQVCAQLFVGVAIVTGITAALTLLMSCVVHRNERLATKVSIAVSMQNFILLKSCHPYGGHQTKVHDPLPHTIHVSHVLFN